MNAARYSRSERLQRVVSLMGDHRERSTAEIQREARVCNAHSCIAELRQNGFRFPKATSRHIRGKRRWFYQLKRRA